MGRDALPSSQPDWRFFVIAQSFKLTQSLKRVAVVVAVAGLVSGLAAVQSPAASAATSCGGSRIDSMVLKAGSASAGRAELWYSGANGGTNCVIVYDNLAGSHVIGAYIDRGNSGGWDKSDVGNFQYYAGPISLKNMARTCVSWGGNLYVGRTYYSAFRFNTHCG
jgi:hypothetical protein